MPPASGRSALSSEGLITRTGGGAADGAQGVGVGGGVGFFVLVDGRAPDDAASIPMLSLSAAACASEQSQFATRLVARMPGLTACSTRMQTPNPPCQFHGRALALTPMFRYPSLSSPTRILATNEIHRALPRRQCARPLPTCPCKRHLPETPHSSLHSSAVLSTRRRRARLARIFSQGFSAASGTEPAPLLGPHDVHSRDISSGATAHNTSPPPAIKHMGQPLRPDPLL